MARLRRQSSVALVDEFAGGDASPRRKALRLAKRISLPDGQPDDVRHDQPVGRQHQQGQYATLRSTTPQAQGIGVTCQHAIGRVQRLAPLRGSGNGTQAYCWDLTA